MNKEEKANELFIDDRPLDPSALSEYTAEEIEVMFQERFGKYVKPESEEK